VRQATPDYHDLLGNERIDVIDICTPPFTHERIINEAAIAGKQIIVEKPLAVGLTDALAIRKTLQETGAALGVVLNLRYMPLVRRVQETIHGSRFGPVKGVSATIHTLSPAAEWVARPPYDEHGVLYDYFPHVVDLVTWSLQAIPTEVLCLRRTSSEYNAFCVIVELRLPSGETCVMQTDLKWTSATSLRLLRFDAHKQTLFLDLQDQFCQITAGHITPQKRIAELALRFGGLGRRALKGRMAIRHGAMIYHHALLCDFLNDFRMQRGPKISVVDGIMHMAVIDAAVRSSRENRAITIDPQVLL
jgi:predicted dehydrogenase